MPETKTTPEPIPTYTVPKPDDGTTDALGRPLQDVFDHNNPNGIMQAEISAKFPKAGGETVQVPVGEGDEFRLLEKSVDQDQALATAAGGPEGAEEGKAPGPRPDPSRSTTGTGATAAATGNTTDGKPDPKKEAELAKASTSDKK